MNFRQTANEKLKSPAFEPQAVNLILVQVNIEKQILFKK